MKRGRPTKAPETKRVLIAVRVEPETAKLLKAQPEGAGRAIDKLIKQLGQTTMKTTINTVLTVFVALIVALSATACGMPGAIDRAGDKVTAATDALGDKIDAILQQQAEEGAKNNDGGDAVATDSTDDAAVTEYGDTETEIENDTRSVYVATYRKDADTCGGNYGFDKYLKLYSGVSEGKLGGDTFLTDVNGTDSIAITIDPDSAVFTLDVTGSSALDILDCACEIDAAGFTCHCDDAAGESCATVYDVI